MTLKLIVKLAAMAVATTLLASPSLAATPAEIGVVADQGVTGAPVDATDFTKYDGEARAVDAPLDLPPDAQPKSHIQYVRNLASGRLPEPGAWAMMLIGFGGAGYLLRRNRSRARAASI
jgi:hypothetical protein